MSQTVNVNGVSINYPETGDTGWGDEGTAFAVQTSSALSKLGLSTGTTVDLPGTLDVTGVTTLDSNLSVGGNSTLTGNLTVNGNTILGNATSDTITITGAVAIDTNVLIVDPTNNRIGINKTSPAQALDVVGAVAISGNETVGGTLGVTGNTTLSGTLGVTGNTTLSGTLGVTGNTTLTGQLLNSDGTASLPGISFSNDTNTGIYRSASDQISISAGGSEVGRITSTYGGFKGNVIQVQFGSYNTNIVTNSTSTFADSNIFVSITPKYSTSKILILGSIAGISNSTDFVKLRLMRDLTQIQIIADAAYNGSANGQAPINYLDSPNTTSSVTYKVQFARLNAGTASINNYGSTVPMSTITALEIQQ